jgi:hypothetical protein
LRAIVFVLPAIVAIAVALPSVPGTLIRDDHDYVTQNPHVVCGASLPEIFKSGFQPLKPLGLYRPVTTLSLRLDAMLGGEAKPWIFHSTNLALAAAGAALLALLAKNLAARVMPEDAATRAALVAGLLFAVHPARTEAVCWISGRAENLMAFFSLIALALASGPPSVARMFGAAIAAMAAAFSKEQGFAVALLVPVVAPPVSGKRFVQMLVVFGATGIAFALRWKALGGVLLKPGLAPFESLAFADRAAQGLALLFEYARVAFWPHPLLFEYDARALRVAGGFADWRVIAGLAVCALAASAILRARTAPLLASAAGIFVLPLVPVLHVIVPIGEDFAERFLALPVAGAALLLGWLAGRLPRVGFAVAMAAIAAGGILFAVRAAEFRSERILYEALIAKTPASPPAKTLLASSMLLPDGGARPADARELAAAEALLREAVDADPGLAPARVTLQAVVAERRAPSRQKPLPADVEFMNETVRLFPTLPQVHGMLGRAYFEHDMADQARPNLEKELAIMPLDLVAASTLAQLLESRNEKARAQEVAAAVQQRWQALWRRFPGFGPVAIAYARSLADQSRDVDAARAVLREAAGRACRPADKAMVDAMLTDLGGR